MCTCLSGVDQLKILNTTYLTHREKGGSEALYLLFPNMQLKGSNISTVYVISGFPENRSVFYVPVSVDENGDCEDEWEEKPSIERSDL